MASRACVILGRLADHTVGISNKKQIKSVFFVFGSVHTQILENELAIAIFLRQDFGQVLQLLTRMIFIKQIIARVVINFKIAHIYRKLMCRILGNVREYKAQGPRNQPSISVSLRSTGHGKGLTRPRLAIREDSAIVALEATFNDVLSNFIKHCFLSCQHVQDPVELEAVELLPCLEVLERVLCKREFYSTLFWVYT